MSSSKLNPNRFHLNINLPLNNKINKRLIETVKHQLTVIEAKGNRIITPNMTRRAAFTFDRRPRRESRPQYLLRSTAEMLGTGKDVNGRLIFWLFLFSSFFTQFSYETKKAFSSYSQVVFNCVRKRRRFYVRLSVGMDIFL